MTVLYRNTRTLRLRMFQACLWLCLILFAILAWATRVTDPSNMHAAMIVLAALMVPLILLYDIYLRHAVVEIIRRQGELDVSCMTATGRRTYILKRSDIRLSEMIIGRGGATRHVRLHVNGWRWPGVIDVTTDRLQRP
jgi:hypothetical protein